MRNPNVPRLRIISGRVSPQGGRVLYPAEFARRIAEPLPDPEPLSFYEQFRPLPAWLVNGLVTVLIGAAVAITVYLMTVEALR